MANEYFCVFCGEKLGMFNSASFACADVYQPCCKNCVKELKDLSEEEQCRRALQRGCAQQPEKIEQRIELITTAEEHRPSCTQCGGKLKFETVQYLDNSPMRDSVFSEGVELLPAYCESCGKYEFYKPAVINKNRFISYLIHKDTSH